jgi:hypothetical protein
MDIVLDKFGEALVVLYGVLPNSYYSNLFWGHEDGQTFLRGLNWIL